MFLKSNQIVNVNLIKYNKIKAYFVGKLLT